MTLNKTSTDSIIQEWVSIYSDELYRWALHKTSDKETAQDLTQDTFIAAFKAIDTFEGKSQAKTWLFSILNNKIMDHHRKQFKQATINQSQLNGKSKQGDILDNMFDSNGSWTSSASPTDWQEMDEHLLDKPEFKAVLSGCLKKLPSNWNSAIQYKYLEEKNSKEVCQELGITPSNYWQILHRAKLQLRLCIEQNWFKS